MTAFPSILVIGAGPAGLMAADYLSARGYRVAVYDRKASPARKFLMAGRGGLNLTHSEEFISFLARYGAAEPWLRPMVERFSPADLRAWCHALGQDTFVGTSGRVFPQSMKASPLLRVWLARLENQKVSFHLNHTWTGWSGNGEALFTDGTGLHKQVHADATLLCLGGASWPSLGSDGRWTGILAARHVALTPFQPANCGFVIPWSDYFRDRFAGQPLKNIALSCAGKSVAGEMMISRAGIEGGAVYALSSDIRETINLRGTAAMHVDLRPSMTVDQIADKIGLRGRKSLSTVLQKSLGLSPVSVSLLHESDSALSTFPVHDLAKRIKAVPLTTHGPFPIERAISSAGGIARDELDHNLMIKRLPGIFAAGEMIDWEAPTGGYLLQACFSTALHAAKGIEAFAPRP